MPLIPSQGIEIDSVEAEITGAARDAEHSAAAQGPSPDAMLRQMQELMARAEWRAARLNAD